MSLIAIVAASCVDGTGPGELQPGTPIGIQAGVGFASDVTPGELGRLSLARVVALDAATDEVVGVAEQAIDPDAPEWLLRVTVEVPPGTVLSVVLQVELASVGSDGAELVEWSGQTPAVQVVQDAELGEVREVRLVNLFRGPLANLEATGVALASPGGLTFGASGSVVATVEGGGPGTRAFYRGLDNHVAEVDPITGHVETVDTGEARIVALAGPLADTGTVIVLEPMPPDDPAVVQAAAGSVGDAGQRVVAGMEDGPAARRIRDSLTLLSRSLLNSDPIAAIRAFRAAVAAWESYGAGSEILRFQDGPQLSLIQLSLIHVADALGLPYAGT